MDAEITLEYDDEKTAEAVAKAVSPDNFKTPKDLKVETSRHGKRVATVIKCERKMASFIATIDDLLFCASTAEKAIQMARRFE